MPLDLVNARGSYRSDDLHKGAVFQPVNKPEGARLVLLSELRPRQCCFPLFHDGPRLFCGAETEAGSDYCSYHRAIALRPALSTRRAQGSR